MAKRKHIPIKVLYAAALLQMGDDETGEIGSIPHEDAKKMSADQIISLFHADHYPIPHAEGGPDLPWNLVHRFIQKHRKKTAEEDVPRIAKNKRVAEGYAHHLKRIADKGSEDPTRAAITAAQIGLESENPEALGEALKPLAREGLAHPKPVRREKQRKPMRRKKAFR